MRIERTNLSDFVNSLDRMGLLVFKSLQGIVRENKISPFTFLKDAIFVR